MDHQQPDFKPVYILGAGASRAIGAPLLNDYLSRAKQLIYSPDFVKSLDQDFMRDKLKAHFELVFQYQGELLKTRHFLDLNLDNLETLFSILDMDWQIATAGTLGDIDSSPRYQAEDLLKIREALFSLIIATLKVSIDRNRFPYDSLMQAFASSEHSAFITFNYDTSIEDALRQSVNENGVKRHPVDYGCSKETPLNPLPGRRLVLKLHGSGDWTYCSQCDKLTSLEKYITPLELESHRHLLHKPDCPKMKALNVLIPPTWYKYNYLDVFTQIWNRAIREISLATHLFIIGYSFPKTDVFFEQLLTLALRSSRNLKKITIVNPDPEIRNIVTKIFDTHFFARSVTYHALRFEDIAYLAPGKIEEEKDMESFLDSISDREKHPAKYGVTF